MSAPEATGFDLLRLPLVGRFLRWRHARLTMQLPLFLLAVLLVLHGLFGPRRAPDNLATSLTWIHYRGVLVLILLAAGNFFCMACPLLLPRELARLFFRPAFVWPRALRNKWLAVALFVAILFCYEFFSLWEWPIGTALLILGYFVGAFVIDSLFAHASFCKWVCPIGQFNFIASTLSPLEVQVRDRTVCASCKTKDCIKGTPAPAPSADRRQPLPVVRRGCELALFVPRKVGNLDCTFCMDCIGACPHDNIGLVTRVPGGELHVEGTRSGIGEPQRRSDWAALTVAFTFGALVNAFGMVSPVYAFLAWLNGVTGVSSRGGLLGMLFFLGLVVEPIVLLGLTALMTRWLGERRGLLAIVTRYAPSLIPLGFGTWIAHYAFHFLTGALTVIPTIQSAAEIGGVYVLGRPMELRFGGMPDRYVYPLELGLLALGLVGSWLVAWRLAERDAPAGPWRTFIPWAVLHLLMTLAATWLLSQPMEMRGTTFFGG